MKRFVLLALFVSLMFAGFAQTQRFDSRVKVKYDLGIGEDECNSLSAEYLMAYHFNRNFSLGIGTGVGMAEVYDDITVIYDGSSNYVELWVYDRGNFVHIPLYANAKYNLFFNRVSPYIAVDLGYDWIIDTEGSGLMVNPMFGIDIPIKRNRLFVEIGYKFQKCDYPDYGDHIPMSINNSRLSFAVGIQF